MANATAKILADYVLNWFKGTTFHAAPTNVYVALLTTVPTRNDGTGLVECTDAGYARLAVAASGGWSAISLAGDNLHDEISNAAALTFGTVSGAGYTVNGLAIYDASTSGNLLAYGAVTPQAVATGNAYQVAIGGLVLEF